MKSIKKSRLFIAAGLLSAGIVLVAADHLDAPAVAGTTADITDFYF